MKFNLTLDEFKKLIKEYSVVPLYTEILADTETPLSIFLKLKDEGSFNILLESAEGGEKWGRYSFLIKGGSFYIRSRKDVVEVYDAGRISLKNTSDPLGYVKRVLSTFKPMKDGNLPRFWGGLVGYIGYDIIKFYENVPEKDADPVSTNDMFLTLTDLLIVYDNLSAKIKIIVPLIGTDDPEIKYRKAVKKIEETVNTLKEKGDIFLINLEDKEPSLEEWKSNVTKEDFMKKVERAKRYIEEGDVIQVVLSQRFKSKLRAKPENIYRALRTLNPSPYMYYLEMEHCKVIGSSPEILVRLEDGKIETRPIAGTRPRGKTEEEDKRLEEELINDEKERAEHLMLVDLARNDVGRVAEAGTVRVDNFMRIERYSHVMHIVSDVSGKLKKGLDAVDVLKATFPAGTVSGAPKVRAMQIIEELEPERRGIYAGSVGYFSFDGNMDMAITIRTAVIRGDEIFVQAGAGIVADSVPEREWEETVNKAKSMMKAVAMAQDI